MPPLVAAVLMIPVQALIHVAVPSVSGQAVLTMPLFVPMADVLGLSRQVPVLAYQTGAGLMELATPTNGGLMAILLLAGVPFQRWIRFALGGLLLLDPRRDCQPAGRLTLFSPWFLVAGSWSVPGPWSLVLVCPGPWSAPGPGPSWSLVPSLVLGAVLHRGTAWKRRVIFPN